MRRTLFYKILVFTMIMTTMLLTFGYNMTKVKADQLVVSRVATTTDGKGYLEVDGKPFFYFGVQITGKQQLLGDYGVAFPTPMPEDWLENCFEKTAAAGFKTIQIILKWYQIEPVTQNVFDWTLVNKYVDWANEYGLYIDWVWFGANSCGGASLNCMDEWSYSIPLYLDDHDKYFGNGHPFNDSEHHHSPWLPDGGIHNADAEYLWGCERNAVTNLFNHLAVYDINHRSILFQVMNEPNFHPTWNTQNSIHLDLLNRMGQAVKDSNYVVATRVNLWPSVPDSSVNDLPYIDFVGSDPYNTEVGTIAYQIDQTAYSDLTYIAENSGAYDNTSSLAVTAFVHGGFYDVWQLNDHWCNMGIYDGNQVNYTNWALGTLPPLRHSGTDVTNLNGALNKAGSLITTASKEKMTGFNIDQNYPFQNYSGNKNLGDYQVGYTCMDGSVGMSVLKEDSIYCLSDTAGPVPINIAPGKTASMDTDAGWGHVAALSVDDNQDTYTQSFTDVPWDLTIDLGSSHSINKVVFYPNAYNYATQFTIDASANGSTWTTVATETAGNGNAETYTFNAVNARYVKINVSGEQGGGHAIHEVKVYSPEVLSPLSRFTVNAEPSEVTSGHFDSNGSWVVDSYKSYTNNGNGTYDISVGPQELLRIKTNLAEGKAASMDASPGWGHIAAHAVDADWSTFAQSDTDVPWDLTIDLGSVHMVSKVRFEPDPANYANQFTIDTSPDGTAWTTVATETAGAGCAKDYVFSPSAARYVKINVTAEVGGYHAIHDVKVYGIQAPAVITNVALGKTASMNADAGWGHVTDHAVDGNWSTYAQSYTDVPWDLTIDLAANRTISSVVFMPDPANYASQFTIDTSIDGTNWTTAATEAAGVNYARTYTFNPIVARFVRVNVTGEVGSGHAIHEVEVYGF